ncbi:MAG: M20/M25/M40 family metallo-hydrolase, partial [Candidatus Stygibacter australis]|nr:M20/M25/M40 family metallo-hydrolase [Candidatus Stygibacter australis]
GKGVKPVIDGDIIRSESNTILGADDKCGIAMILAVLDEYKESGDAHAPLEIVFSVSEEIGLLGAKALDLSRLRSKRGYVLDGNKIGEVVKASPNQADWKAIIRGKSAHAGVEPEKGNNAIRAAAAAILAIKDGRIDEETTMNCGKICGGIATNIVCDEVKIAGEIRSHNENKLFNLGEEVKEQFQATTREYKCTLEFDLNISFQSTMIDENDELVKLSEQAFKATGITQKLVINGGGSDANVFSRKGLQGIVVGMGMQKIHSINEYIMLDDLKRGRIWLKNVIELWSRR